MKRKIYKRFRLVKYRKFCLYQSKQDNEVKRMLQPYEKARKRPLFLDFNISTVKQRGITTAMETCLLSVFICFGNLL